MGWLMKTCSNNLIILIYIKCWKLTSPMSPHRPVNGPPRVLYSQMLSCTGGSNCRGRQGRRLWSSSQWWGCTCNCEGILGTHKIAGKFFKDIEFLKPWCRSFVNYGIVEFVGIQDDIIPWMEYLCYHKNFLIAKCFGFLDQPARQTSKKHILSNTNACCKGSNGVSYTFTWRSMAIHARFINFHVVKYAPDMEPHPLQVSDNKLDMTKEHLDRVELIKYFLMGGWRIEECHSSGTDCWYFVMWSVRKILSSLYICGQSFHKPDMGPLSGSKWSGDWAMWDSSHMAMIGNVRLSPFGRIVITITCVSMQLDMMITKWGERNIIHVCQSDKWFPIQDDCPNETIKRLEATCRA